MIRDLILTLTILALIGIAANQSHIKTVQVAYCVIDYKAAGKHPITGETVTGWARGYGPCSFLDRYEFI